MILTYKYRIKDRTARKALSRHAWACNQVWNWCVSQQLDIQARYNAGAPKRRWSTRFDLIKMTKGVGRDLGIHQQTVGVVCQQFSVARDMAKRAPTFRSSFGKGRARGWVPFQEQSRKIDGNSITYLGKRYRFFGSKHRPVPDTATGGCFVEDARGRWYVCFWCSVSDRAKSSGTSIGIDLGLDSFVTTSDGRKVPAPRFFRKMEKKLGIAQRSNNKPRARSIRAKIRNSRRDFLHKLSTGLAREHSFIAVGAVNPVGLAQTIMAKSVYDAGWSAFRSMLQYKTPGYVEVDEKFTTRTCSCCGTVSREWPKGIAGLGIREWQCSDCGESHDRDVNAARNILRLALSTQRLVEESRWLAKLGGSRISTNQLSVPHQLMSCDDLVAA